MMTTKLKVRFYGDPCLRKKSSPVKSVGPAERMLIQAMLETMYEHKGVGLAAPQVGINEQIFVTDIGQGQGPIAFVNPHIIKKSGFLKQEEGCLSIPGVVVKVKRAEKIKVRYLNQYNKVVVEEFPELLARVIQHETDHLHGKLIVDYASFFEKKKIKEQLKNLCDQVAKGPSDQA